MSSASVLDLATIECFFDQESTGTASPTVIELPVCDFPSGCTPYGCIHLGPTNNLTGGALMWSLRSQVVVHRNQFNQLPVPDLVVGILDGLANDDISNGRITQVDASDSGHAEPSLQQDEVIEITDLAMEPPAVTITPQLFPALHGPSPTIGGAHGEISHLTGTTHTDNDAFTPTEIGGAEIVRDNSNFNDAPSGTDYPPSLLNYRHPLLTAETRPFSREAAGSQQPHGHPTDTPGPTAYSISSSRRAISATQSSSISWPPPCMLEGTGTTDTLPST
jgi:hypothetical protein